MVSTSSTGGGRGGPVAWLTLVYLLFAKRAWLTRVGHLLVAFGAMLFGRRPSVEEVAQRPSRDRVTGQRTGSGVS